MKVPKAWYSSSVNWKLLPLAMVNGAMSWSTLLMFGGSMPSISGNRDRAVLQKPPLTIRIGIDSGPAILGEAGTARRSTLACVGTTPRRAES